MNPNLLLAIGAEAEIYRHDSKIVKRRTAKQYRAPRIDERLRGTRTRREAKVMSALLKLFPVPRLLHCDGKSVIEMEFVDGKLLRDALSRENFSGICGAIGRQVALMHNISVIHGDLTTSNMILAEQGNEDNVYFIDFGLSFFSEKEEDKAVDLHLLRQSLSAAHSSLWEECFAKILESYRESSNDAEKVLRRLEAVEKRGRYKGKKWIG